MSIVTDEMIEAGCAAYRRSHHGEPMPGDIEAIYLAMKAAEPAGDVERVAQAIALVYNRDAGSTAHDVVEIDREAARAAIAAATPGDALQ